MSERTPMEALRSALRFAASRSCITSAEELAIMDAWNTRQPDQAAMIEAARRMRELATARAVEYSKGWPKEWGVNWVAQAAKAILALDPASIIGEET